MQQIKKMDVGVFFLFISFKAECCLLVSYRLGKFLSRTSFQSRSIYRKSRSTSRAYIITSQTDGRND